MLLYYYKGEGHPMLHFKTDRLTIRPFLESDAVDVYAYLSDPEVLKYEPYLPASKEEVIKETKRRTEDTNFLAVCLDNKVIGNLYFSKGDFDTWEIGYVFNKNYWGKGYASESVNAIMVYGFNYLGARRIKALCDPNNIRSWKLLERIEMRREAHQLQNVYFFKDTNGNPIWKDTYQYAILKSEYENATNR